MPGETRCGGTARPPPRSFSLTPCFASPSLHVPCYIKLSASSKRNNPTGNASMSAQAARAPSPQPPILLRETIGSIAVLTLNRPAARNSLSETVIASLHAELNEIRADRTVRGVVIAANGPAFSAGHDMKELTARRADPDRGRAFFAEMMTACSAMMQAIV